MKNSKTIQLNQRLSCTAFELSVGQILSLFWLMDDFYYPSQLLDTQMHLQTIRLLNQPFGLGGIMFRLQYISLVLVTSEEYLLGFSNQQWHRHPTTLFDTDLAGTKVKLGLYY